MVVAPNRWSADAVPGQETWITVLYLQRGGEGGEGGREGGREGGGGGGELVTCHGCGS